MPNRMLKEGIKRSAQIDQLSWFEEVVFYRLLVTADDYGCVDGRSILLRNDLFPTKDNVTKKAVEDAVNHLASVGLLRKYAVSGTPYLFFPTWEKHQRLRAKKRKYPAPPSDVMCPTFDEHLTDTCPTDDGQVTDTRLLELEEELETLSNESVTHTRTKSKKFVPPTVEQVREYCVERGNHVDPNRFVDYYTANGWKVGRSSMKDWKAAVRNWESGEKANYSSGQSGKIDPSIKRVIDRRLANRANADAEIDPMAKKSIEKLMSLNFDTIDLEEDDDE